MEWLEEPRSQTGILGERQAEWHKALEDPEGEDKGYVMNSEEFPFWDYMGAVSPPKF